MPWDLIARASIFQNFSKFSKISQTPYISLLHMLIVLCTIIHTAAHYIKWTHVYYVVILILSDDLTLGSYAPDYAHQAYGCRWPSLLSQMVFLLTLSGLEGTLQGLRNQWMAIIKMCVCVHVCVRTCVHVCQTAANDCLGLSCGLCLFLSRIEDKTQHCLLPTS